MNDGGFIRPEARAALWRWRDVLAGGAIVVVGLLAIGSLSDLLVGLGIAAICLGALLILNGIRRARFPGQGGGVGMVEVRERKITYFGPYGGGAVSLDDLARIQIRTTQAGPLEPDLFWMFTTQDGELLSVPGQAEGVETLFDALAALDGVDYAAATAAAGTVRNQLFDIWQRPDQKAALTP